MEVKANTANKASTSQYVNYLDVKLIGIDNLPKDWYEGNSTVNGEAPSFANHPFRYEVRIDFPSHELLTPKEDKKSKENLLQHEQEKSVKRDSAKENIPDSGVSNNNVNIVSNKNTNALRNANEMNSKETETTSVNVTKSASAPVSVPQNWVELVGSSSLERSAVQSFTFTHGRLLQPLPEYVEYIHHATYTPLPSSSTTKTKTINESSTSDNAEKATYALADMQTKNHSNENEKQDNEKEEETDIYAELTSPFELPEELLKYTMEHDLQNPTSINHNPKQEWEKEPHSESSSSGTAAKQHNTDAPQTPQLM